MMNAPKFLAVNLDYSPATWFTRCMQNTENPTATKCETCQLEAKRLTDGLTEAEFARWSMWGCTCSTVQPTEIGRYGIPLYAGPDGKLYSIPE